MLTSTKTTCPVDKSHRAYRNEGWLSAAKRIPAESGVWCRDCAAQAKQRGVAQ